MPTSLTNSLRACCMAIGLLTRFPVPRQFSANYSALGRSLHWYPVVGLTIALPLLALTTFLAAGPLLAAIIAVTLWVCLTGGLHLDGLADCADAWVGGMGNRERTLNILKDPACGPMGAIALILILLLKVAAVDTLLRAEITLPWWLIPVLARTALAIVFVTVPYVRPGGMGAGIAATASTPAIAAVSAVVLLTMAMFMPAILWWLWLTTAAGLFFLWRTAMMQRLNGFTGDGAGALVELLETALLLSSALYLSAIT